MTFKKHEIYYFQKPGEENTDYVVEAVIEAVERGGIRDIVVSSTTGATALKFASAIKDEARIICVSESAYRKAWDMEYPCMDQKNKEELEAMGAIVLDKVPYLLLNSLYETSGRNVLSPETVFKDTLYAFGQGMKVAVEVVLTAVACGALEPYKYVIGIGGSGAGADTAIVLKSTYPTTVFDKEPKKRLEIREILAMPLDKMWWE
jgi:hypothetical protein